MFFISKNEKRIESYYPDKYSNQLLCHNLIFLIFFAEGDRLAFSAKVKYQKEGKTVHCDPNTWDGATRCSDILMYTKNEAGTRQYHRVAEVSTTTPDAEGW